MNLPFRRVDRGAALTSELVPLGTRVRSLWAMRVGMVAVVVASRVAAPDVVTGELIALARYSALYVAATAIAEIVRQLFGRGLELLAITLLADGLYLAQVVSATGGSSSVLRSLITIHVVAVTLVVSYRTGLKVAVWHIMLLTLTQGSTRSPSEAGRTIAFAVAILLVATAVASFSAVNERELRRRRADVEALHGFALALDHARHPTDVARTLVQHAMAMVGFTDVIVIGYRQGSPSVLATTGGVKAAPGDVVAVGAGSAIDRAWSERATVLLREPDPDVDRWLAAALGGAQRVAVVPLFADGHPAGVVVGVFGRLRNDRVERSLVVTAEQLGAHASLALRNAWLLHDVEELAVTDGLTRLANRRHLESALNRELQRGKSDSTPIGFVLVDLDRFKALNDTYGHLAGDEVLRRVGDVLVSAAEPGDTVARYGGEEFALVLPGRDRSAAAALAERVRTQIETLEGPHPVTASLGVSSFPADAIDGPSLVLAADEALYESKRAGRNRVTAASRKVSGWLDLPWRTHDLEDPPVLADR